MNRQLLDTIKNAVQSAYNLYCKTHLRSICKKSYREFIEAYGEIKRPDPREYFDYWKRLSRVDPTGYQIYYTLTGLKDKEFVSKEVYYTLIEPCINDYTMSKPYRDKNSYERFFKMDVFPTAVLRNINGVFYDREYSALTRKQVTDLLADLPKKYDKVFLKPSIFSGMRTNVKRIDLAHEQLSLDYLDSQYKRDYLIQEYVEQSGYFDQFGKFINVRISTYRSVSDNKIIPHDMGMSINNDPNPVRAKTASEVLAINTEGHLSSFALNKFWGISYTIPDTNIKFSDVEKIKYFEDMQKIATEIALASPYHRRLGLDMIVDKNEKVKVYDINYDRLGFEMSQYMNGAIFKGYTDEIIEYCKAHRSDIKFVFTN
jgi:hypothetical protein